MRNWWVACILCNSFSPQLLPELSCQMSNAPSLTLWCTSLLLPFPDWTSKRWMVWKRKSREECWARVARGRRRKQQKSNAAKRMDRDESLPSICCLKELIQMTTRMGWPCWKGRKYRKWHTWGGQRVKYPQVPFCRGGTVTLSPTSGHSLPRISKGLSAAVKWRN